MKIIRLFPLCAAVALLVIAAACEGSNQNQPDGDETELLDDQQEEPDVVEDEPDTEPADGDELDGDDGPDEPDIEEEPGDQPDEEPADLPDEEPGDDQSDDQPADGDDLDDADGPDEPDIEEEPADQPDEQPADEEPTDGDVEDILPDQEPEPEDLVAPHVTQVIPADGATGVEVTLSQLLIDFSEQLGEVAPADWSGVRLFPSDSPGGQDDITLYSGGMFVLPSGGTQFVMTVDPAVDLAHGRQYTISVSDVFRDLAGNALTPFESTFTTEAAPVDGDGEDTPADQEPGSEDVTPPVVTAVVPADGAMNVSVLTNEITIDFSEQLGAVSPADWNGVRLYPSSVSDGSADILLFSSGMLTTLEGTTRFIMNLEATADLDYATPYTISVSEVFHDEAGNPLVPFESTFTTEAAPADGDVDSSDLPVETDNEDQAADLEPDPEPEDPTPPYVTAVIPADGAVNVPVNPGDIQIDFSEKLATVQPDDWYGVRLYPSDTPDGSADLTLLTSGAITTPGGFTRFLMHLNAYVDLAFDTQYTISVSNVFTDLAGNPLIPFESTFTTVAAPVDGDSEETPQEEEEPPEGGIITGTLYTTMEFFYEDVKVYLYDEPPIDSGVSPIATLEYPNPDYVAYTFTYAFEGLSAGQYWLTAWFDYDGTGTVNPMQELARCTYAPIVVDPAVQPLVENIDMYFDVQDPGLGQIAGRITLPESVYDPAMVLPVYVYRQNPDAVSTAPVAALYADDPKLSTRSFGYGAVNLPTGDYWVRVQVDVCDDGDESNDIFQGPAISEPVTLDLESGPFWNLNVNVDFDDASLFVCGGGDEDGEAEAADEAEPEVEGCTQDDDCYGYNVCHQQAFGGQGDCDLPCTSNAYCTTRYGADFFCNPDAYCVLPVTLPAAIPDGHNQLELLHRITDTATIASAVCFQVSFTHPQMGDLYAFIESPQGGLETLFYFEDLMDTQDFSGAFTSTSFNGSSRAGFWTLTVMDNTTGNAGTLDSFWMGFDQNCADTDGDQDSAEAEEEEAAPRAGSCANPLDGVLISTIAGLDNLLDPVACNGFAGAAGPENAHRYDMLPGWTMDASIVFTQFDVVLYVMTPCGNAPLSEPFGSCQGVNAVTGVGNEALSFTAPYGGTYYLVVDSTAGSSGQYILNVNIHE